MILGAEIGLLVWGIVVLSTGKMQLGQNRIVYGTPARLLTILCFAPLPLAFCVGFVIGLAQGIQGNQAHFDSMRWTYALVEGGIVLACVVLLYAIGWNLAGPPPEKIAYGQPRRSPRDEPLEADLVDPAPLPALPIQVAAQCPKCRTAFQLDANLAGKKVRCGSCQEIFAVPSLATDAITARITKPSPPPSPF